MCFREARLDIFPALLVTNARPLTGSVRPTRKTSYGEGNAKEMAAINPILIIVNSTGF